MCSSTAPTRRRGGLPRGHEGCASARDRRTNRTGSRPARPYGRSAIAANTQPPDLRHRAKEDDATRRNVAYCPQMLNAPLGDQILVSESRQSNRVKSTV
jgi:hypothetical protein